MNYMTRWSYVWQCEYERWAASTYGSLWFSVSFLMMSKLYGRWDCRGAYLFTPRLFFSFCFRLSSPADKREEKSAEIFLAISSPASTAFDADAFQLYGYYGVGKVPCFWILQNNMPSSFRRSFCFCRSSSRLAPTTRGPISFLAGKKTKTRNSKMIFHFPIQAFVDALHIFLLN